MELIKVLVVDDSSMMRKLISKMVEDDPELTVADTAMNGIFALKKLEKCDPDIILLDIQMPGMDGIEFLEKCKTIGLDIPVIVLSSLGKNRPEITLKCLSLGAKDFIIKPSGTISLDIEMVQEEVISKIKFFYREHPKHHLKKDVLKETLENIAQSKKSHTIVKPSAETAEELPTKDISKLVSDKKVKSIPSLEAIVIGTSTGGPYALRKIIPLFPSNFPLPILIVQHMPAGFTSEFANGLDEISKVTVKECEDGETIENGFVYIAPGDRHITIKKENNINFLSLSNSEEVCGHKPSAEVLFKSASQAFENRVIALIMTGMGKDGAKGIRQVKLNGGITLAQSEKTCVIFGMPKVAIELGGIDEVIDLDDIPSRIIEITTKILH